MFVGREIGAQKNRSPSEQDSGTESRFAGNSSRFAFESGETGGKRLSGCLSRGPRELKTHAHFPLEEFPRKSENLHMRTRAPRPKGISRRFSKSVKTIMKLRWGMAKVSTKKKKKAKPSNKCPTYKKWEPKPPKGEKKPRGPRGPKKCGKKGVGHVRHARKHV